MFTSRDQVALLLDEARVVIHMGSVIDTAPKGVYTVQWEDGTREMVRAGSRDGRMVLVVPVGSLNYWKWVDPSHVSRLLEESPVEAFMLALMDSDEPQSAKTLIDHLGEFRPRDEVSAIWKKARTAFADAPGVTQTGGRQPAYKWKPQEQEAPNVSAADTGHRSQAQAHATRPAASASGDEGAQVSFATAALPQDEEAVGRVFTAQPRRRERSRPKPDPRPTSGPEPSDAPPRTPLERLLTSVVAGDVDKPALHHVRRHPLSSALAAAEWADEAKKAFHEAAMPSLRFLVRDVALTESEVSAAAAVLDDGLVSAAIEELRAERSEHHRRPLRTEFLRWVDELLATREGHLPLESIVTLARGLVECGSPEKRSEALLDHAVERLRAARRDAQLPAGWDRVLQDLAAKVPLRHEGARYRLIRAVAARDPRALRTPGWWAGVTFDQLADTLQAPLPKALRDEVVNTLLAPITARALADASSRRRLLTVLSAPVDLVDTLRSEEVRDAWRRVASDDASFAAWDEAIRDPKALHAALEDRDRLVAAVRVADQARDDSASRARDLLARAERAEAGLREAERAASELRESQARQIRIDAVRALAELASYVEGAIGRQPADRIIARIHAIAGKHALETLGEVETTVPYDPGRHDLVGAPLAAGDLVVVRRAGYTWRTGSEELVLVRALVEPTHRD